MRKTIIITCIVLLYGCSQKSDFIPVYNVPAEFQPYVDSFEAAGVERGYNITVNNLIIAYDSSVSNSYCAVSNTTSTDNNIQKIIYINPDIHCWQNSRQLETLLFHEMGHCILGRQHDTTLLPNGDAKSIMIADDISLYAPCIYPLADSCNQLYKRDYYLDELFNMATPVPDWAK